MKYKFKKTVYDIGGGKTSFDFGVDRDSLDDTIKALININWWGWTPKEIQMIIDKSKALTDNQEFDYQVEGSGFLMSIDKDEVYFYDMHNDQKEEDFKWSFSEFIDFMEKFKKFVEENS